MAEEEVIYTSVVFKNKTHTPPEVSAGFLPDKKANRRRNYQQLACCLGIVILLLGIIAVCVYLYIGNLTQAYTVLESKITNLTVENQNLTAENKLLKTQRDNLTEQIRNTETKWNEHNVTRAQWSIDAYCPENNGNRQCKPCEDGWEPFKSSCYAFNDADSAKRRTWEGAQQDCRGKISDLAVIVNKDEKKFIRDCKYGKGGFWIGLRVEDGRWKWIDGSDLTENSWTQPPTNGHCAISARNKGWESVTCGKKKQWICKKKALSV